MPEDDKAGFPTMHTRWLFRPAMAAMALFGLAAWSAGPPPGPATERARAPTYLAVPSLADGAVPASCAPIAAEDGWAVKDRLLGMQVVYGKPAIDWGEADYRGIIALARACNRAIVDGKTIDGDSWANMIVGAYDRVSPVAGLARQVESFRAALGSDGVRLPRCPALLDFEVDTYAQRDDSARLFGTDFLAQTDDDLNRVVLYANQCLTYLPDYAFMARSWQPDRARDMLGRVMDRALLVVKRRQDWAEWDRRDTDLVLRLDGLVVPPTMTSPRAREMIERYDRAAAAGRKFTSDSVVALVRLSDDVLEANVNALDVLYAEEVRRTIHRQIFGGTE